MAGKHFCTKNCRHTCAESGGRTKAGKDCTRLGGWGIDGVTVGHRLLCRQHDPEQAPTYQAKGGANERQNRFIEFYCGVAHGNGTKAARLAGYGTTDESAGATACILLKNARVREAINERFAELSMPSQEVTKRMTDDARLDMAPLLELTADGQPKMKLTQELLDQYGPLIKEIKVDKLGFVTEIKLNDSQAARRDMAKIRQLFSDAPQTNIFFNVQQLSDDQLQERLGALRTKVQAGRPGSVAVAVRKQQGSQERHAVVLPLNGRNGKNGRHE